MVASNKFVYHLYPILKLSEMRRDVQVGSVAWKDRAVRYLCTVGTPVVAAPDFTELSCPGCLQVPFYDLFANPVRQILFVCAVRASVSIERFSHLCRRASAV